MRLVEGGRLADKMRQWREMKQPLALIDALNLIAQLADALDHVHKKGALHHSLTPKNVFIRRTPQTFTHLPANTPTITYQFTHHVSHIIMKALAKQPEQRFQTGHELAVDLRTASTHLDINLVTSELDVINLQKRINRGKLPRLYIAYPYETTRIIPLDQEELIIGRSSNNDIRRSDESISRRHIHLRFKSGNLVVIDLV